MVRAASITINGFYYQFLHTIKLCLETFTEECDTKIICEGKEDIDYIRQGSEILIQVKTSKNPINITKGSFKKSILNFYKEHQRGTNSLFVFHTNATPAKEVIDGEKCFILSDWENHKKNFWEDSVGVLKLITTLKQVISDYAISQGEADLDFSSFNEDFVKKIHLEFNSSDSAIYEATIKQKIKEKYPRSDENYREVLFLNLLNLVIKKSIAEDVSLRIINYAVFNDILNKTEEMIDIKLKGEEGETISLKQLVKEIEVIKDQTEGISQGVATLLNNGLIDYNNPPSDLTKEYSEYPFIVKLETAKIPSDLIFLAKDNFYQAEYAMEKANIFTSEKKKKEINRIKQSIKLFYILERADAKSSLSLLKDTTDKIIREHNNVLTCSLGFDFFHKIGLLHHLANEDNQIIWEIITNEN